MANLKHKDLARKKKIELGVYTDVKKSLADIRSAQKRIDLAQESQKEAKEALRLENLKYKNGKGIINDVLDAETAVRDADALLYAARADYNTSVFEFMFARGDLLEGYKKLIHSAASNPTIYGEDKSAASVSTLSKP